jgi:hypothetical protein
MNESLTLSLNLLRIKNSPNKEIVQSNQLIQTNPSFLYQWKPWESRFPITFKLACAVQTLPYSSVSLERRFSQLTDIKTVKRNRLLVENLQACLLIEQEFRDDRLSEEILERYLSQSVQHIDISPENKKQELLEREKIS